MADYSTAMSAMAQRAVEAVIDSVAKDGLAALKSVLDRSGFAGSEVLRGYTVSAHVSGDTIEFEVLVPSDAVERTPEVEEEIARAREEAEADQERDFERAAVRSFTLIKGRAVRDRRGDARRPARDARRPAKDARLTSAGRLLRHEIALQAPRSMSLNQEGKLSLRFKRSVRETSRGFEYPKRRLGGSVGDFMDKLRDIIAKRFMPELESIIARIVP